MNTNSAQQHSKVALVTGGARRVGATICRHFHQQGFALIVHYNSSNTDADNLVTQLNQVRPSSAIAVQANLCDNKQVNALAAQSLAAFADIDVLVNNASSFYPTDLISTTQDDWNDLIGSNLTGAFTLSQLLAANLVKNKGAIVNIIDSHADQSLKGYSVYSIAKAGLKTMTRSLAKELAPQVRVNSVSPGAMLWPENGLINAQTKTAIIKQIPAGRLGSPQDVADVVYFLAQEATYMTGADIKVDGGRGIG